MPWDTFWSPALGHLWADNSSNDDRNKKKSLTPYRYLKTR